MPQVSVIIPATAGVGDIGRAIDSALAQTLDDMEALVCGEAAARPEWPSGLDSSPTVRWIELDRSLVSKNDSSGDRQSPTCGAALNAAIRRSVGEVVALLDPTAVWSPHKLALCVRHLIDHPQDDVVYTPAVFVDRQGATHAPLPAAALPAGWILTELFEEPWIVESAAVFRRGVWERHGGFDESLTVTLGQNFFLRVGRAHRFGVISEPLTTVYTEPTSRPTLAESARQAREAGEMLHRFYREQGGDERVDRLRGRRALGAVCQQAARLTWQTGDAPQTLRALFGANEYQPHWRTRWFAAWIRWRTGATIANAPAF